MKEKNVKTTKRAHAFKCYASSYNVEFLNSFNSKLQLKDTESAIKNKLKKLLTELRGFKFVTTCVLEFKKIEIDDKAKYGTFYLHSNAETIIDQNDVDDIFKSIYYSTIISNIQKFLGKVWGWIIVSVIDKNINSSKYNPLAGSSYIKFPK